MPLNTRFLAATSILLSVATSSCLFGEKRANKAGDDLRSLTWPEIMTKHLADSGYKEAYGLFTSSGWSNVGQVMVYSGHTKKDMKVEWVESNGKSIAGTYTLPAKKADSLKAIFKNASKLKDVEPPVFDGVQFNYRHITKSPSGTIAVKHKVFMNNPDQADPKPERHLTLINAMLALKKTENKQKDRDRP